MGLVREIWSAEDVPDLRLFQRLMAVVALLVTRLQVLPVVLRRAMRRGATRFFNNHRISAKRLAMTAHKKLLAPLAQQSELIVAHDSSEIDEHGRGVPSDAGPLRSSNSRGYMIHMSVGMSPDGLMHGLIDAWAWTRSWELRNGDHDRRSMKDKESSKWDKGIDQAEKLLKENGFKGKAWHVEDREADIFEHLGNQKAKKRLLVVRCDLSKERNVLVNGEKIALTQMLDSLPVQSTVKIEVDSRVRDKARGQTHCKRTATLAIKYSAVTLCAPKRYNEKQYKQGLLLWVVQAQEVDAPQDTEPLHWVLWSLAPVNTLEDALKVKDTYQSRWGVEEFFFVCKTGCRLEAEHIDSLASFQRLLIVVAVTATHLVRWTSAARTTPEQPAIDLVESETLQALADACKFHGVKLPSALQTIGQVMLTLAKLGGYEPRPDKPYGWRIVWRGWTTLQQHRAIIAHYRAQLRC